MIQSIEKVNFSVKLRKSPRLAWLPLPLILGLYLLISVGYSFSVPVWEAPDEPAHFAYIQHIRTQGGPPIQSFEQGKNEVETGHHPPLYYYIGALVTLPIDVSDFSQIKTNSYFSFSNTDGGVNRFEHDVSDKLYPNTILAVHLVRLVSVLFGAGTLICTYFCGLLLFRGKQWAGQLPAILATVLVAFLPQFGFLSGAINNDNAVIFFCAFSLYLCIRLVCHSERSEESQILRFAQNDKITRRQMLFFGLIGLVIGLGLLSKYNAAIFIPLVGLALAMAARQRRSWAYFWWGGLISGAVCIAVAVWWFVRAQVLYGDPMGWNMWRSSFRSVDQSDSFQLTGAFLAHTWERWFSSFWGYYGWFNLPLDPEIYKWLARFSAVIAIGIVGLLVSPLFGLVNWKKQSLQKYRSVARKQSYAHTPSGRERSEASNRPFTTFRVTVFATAFQKQNVGGFWSGMLFVVLTIGLTVVVAFNYAATFGDAGTQGRYLFPALPAFGLLASAGLCWLIGLVRLFPLGWWERGKTARFIGSRVASYNWVRGVGWAVTGMVGVVLLWLNVYAQNDIIKPAYLPLADLQAQVVLKDLPSDAIKQDSYFLPNMRLEGYRLQPNSREAIKAGELRLTLYWRATKTTNENWVSFVLLQDGGQVIARSDGAPAQGRLQIYKWRQGDLIKDERVFILKDWQVRQMQQYNAPLQLYLGWLNPDNHKRATLEQGGDALIIDWK